MTRAKKTGQVVKNRKGVNERVKLEAAGWLVAERSRDEVRQMQNENITVRCVKMWFRKSGHFGTLIYLFENENS